MFFTYDQQFINLPVIHSIELLQAKATGLIYLNWAPPKLD